MWVGQVAGPSRSCCGCLLEKVAAAQVTRVLVSRQFTATKRLTSNAKVCRYFYACGLTAHRNFMLRTGTRLPRNGVDIEDARAKSPSQRSQSEHKKHEVVFSHRHIHKGSSI